ncbi:aminoglycoside phosphotransferase (APT) family kinase protein [Paenarthrobacter nitroguajacolicus]|uniref:serine protease inhibitor n=1 Tax=Paenarthrobacter TaxID=1742992 RepID=UPI0028667EE4|nr:serine protease inhibitor [Paenarthrobacter nitroguajacolicus]MDR6986526.1 aminoglycoside phosphotransferase (APT) family kinase protein [Paenarthrobacter nitroguajacolicus]
MVSPDTSQPDKNTYDVDLTVTLTEAPGAESHEFHLRSAAGIMSPDPDSLDSNLPDAPAALAAVEQFGEEIFFPEPRPDRICTQQYGGPQVAVVTGWFRGRKVHSQFSRTDGCEIARWKTLAALLGNTGGSTGAV